MAEPVTLPDQVVYRGDDFSFTINDVAADGTTPTDLTAFGSSFTADIRTSEDAEPPVTFTVDASAAATGVLTLSLTAAQTAAFIGGTYVYDLQASGSSTTTLYRGQLLVVRDVTHA